MLHGKVSPGKVCPYYMRGMRCCFDYVKKPIPQRNLRSFERTNARCSMQAVVFITHVNRQMCADPNAQWVQDRIKYLSQN
uniref:C-C motif chemokine n=1 Tax=Pseudonaja textilis TaxID=8673 RepID=A0A670YUJ1_PSETE